MNSRTTLRTYGHQRRQLNKIARRGFVNEHDRKALVATLDTQLRRDGERRIAEMRRQHKEGL